MQAVRGPELISGDRRAERRYALELQLRLAFPRRGSTVQGAGLTMDLSRTGILFTTDCPPRDGQAIELRISWPYLLQGVYPLELLARGRIVSTDSRGTLFRVRITRFAPAAPVPSPSRQ